MTDLIITTIIAIAFLICIFISIGTAKEIKFLIKKDLLNRGKESGKKK